MRGRVWNGAFYLHSSPISLGIEHAMRTAPISISSVSLISGINRRGIGTFLLIRLNRQATPPRPPPMSRSRSTGRSLLNDLYNGPGRDFLPLSTLRNLLSRCASFDLLTGSQSIKALLIARKGNQFNYSSGWWWTVQKRTSNEGPSVPPPTIFLSLSFYFSSFMRFPAFLCFLRSLPSIP